MVLFESLGTVSYSPSIVGTMAVSVAVCDIFSVKEWPDLENRVRVRSSVCIKNVSPKFVMSMSVPQMLYKCCE